MDLPVDSQIESRAAVERRRYARQRTTIPVKQIMTGPLSFSYQARIMEYSQTGGGLEFDQPPQLFLNQKVIMRTTDFPGSKGLPVVLEGTIQNKHSPYHYGVRFNSLLQEQIKTQGVRKAKLITVAAAVVVAGLIVYLKSRNIISFWYGPLLQSYSLCAAAYLISRAVISCFYKEPDDNGITPSVSLVISVKNEEEHMAETVANCLNSRYPADKLELIVVDDGSTDKTWDVMMELKKKYPQVQCYQFKENRGKRHGMALGMRVAKGDILIFIDSDSMLEPEAVYRLVQPFHDPRIGAVAGHTEVIVEPNNLISKMESVRYFVSQRVMKAAESVFNSVTCCPGPLSAYRRSAVLPIVDAWENQMFFGTKATFGDDRSLTNFILRNFRVVYHKAARCHTYTPNTMKVFIRQQLRWKKSWMRELTVSSLFMWKKHPVAAFSYYMNVIITLVSPMIAFMAVFGAILAGSTMHSFAYLGGLLLAYTFLGLVFHYHTQSKYWGYGVLFAIFYVFIFSFQNYYALLTVRRNHWGTR